MSIFTSKIAICGGLLLLTLVSGVWLSHSGDPYNSLIFSIHKLIALATVIIIGMNVYRLYGTVEASPLAILSLIAISGLLFLALFISGSLLSLVSATLLSLEKPILEATLKTHQVTPLLALLASMATLYFLSLSKA